MESCLRVLSKSEIRARSKHEKFSGLAVPLFKDRRALCLRTLKKKKLKDIWFLLSRPDSWPDPGLETKHPDGTEPSGSRQQLFVFTSVYLREMRRTQRWQDYFLWLCMLWNAHDVSPVLSWYGTLDGFPFVYTLYFLINTIFSYMACGGTFSRSAHINYKSLDSNGKYVPRHCFLLTVAN